MSAGGITVRPSALGSKERSLQVKMAAQKCSEAIQQDHKFVVENLPPSAIITLSDVYVCVVVMRTPYARVQLRVQYVEEYPVKPPIVELTNSTLPLALLRNKEKESVEKAVALKGKAGFAAVYEHIYNFIHTNMFIPAWKEMKQVATMFADATKGKVSADDKEGALKIRMTHGQYTLLVKITVPLRYPETGAKVEFNHSNFTEDIQYMFKAQAEEIVRFVVC